MLKILNWHQYIGVGQRPFLVHTPGGAKEYDRYHLPDWEKYDFQIGTEGVEYP